MFRIARVLSIISILLLLLNCILYIGYWSHSLKIVHDESYFNRTLARILKPRWVGSRGHAEVAAFLMEELQALGFATLRDTFFDQKFFTNIVGFVNRDAKKYVLLTCHYDTAFVKNASHYVGATDSGVSCAILLDLAKTLGPFLREEFSNNKDIGLVLVFFDGHEPLSINEAYGYRNGSRHFADAEIVPVQNIIVVITLNLIGAPNQTFMSHFERTFELHHSLAEIEAELEMSGQLLKSHKLFHKLKSHNTDIEDDHYSFLNEGVAVMHISPHTFPDNWHTVEDDERSLDWPTVRNMNFILTRFVCEFLRNHEKFKLPWTTDMHYLNVGNMNGL